MDTIFAENFEKLATENPNFRKVLYTGPNSQVVAMSIPVGEEIGEETHAKNDQVFIFVDGEGEAVVGAETKKVEKYTLVVVPAGSVHNIKNTSGEPLKFLTIYAPPVHPEGTVHETKEDAQKAEGEY